MINKIDLLAQEVGTLPVGPKDVIEKRTASKLMIQDPFKLVVIALTSLERLVVLLPTVSAWA